MHRAVLCVWLIWDPLRKKTLLVFTYPGGIVRKARYKTETADQGQYDDEPMTLFTVFPSACYTVWTRSEAFALHKSAGPIL